jgi:hypothetical protein
MTRKCWPLTKRRSLGSADARTRRIVSYGSANATAEFAPDVKHYLATHRVAGHGEVFYGYRIGQ